jgi:hypothetical protein
MSFKRLETDDFVVSTEAISATAWTTNTPSLNAIFTSSAQLSSSNGDFYLNVFDTSLTSSTQFAIAYGNQKGSGSVNYNQLVDGKSPTSTVFGQWQDLVIGDENTLFQFGPISSSEFFALPLERQCYKDSIFLGSLSLTLNGPSGSVTLTDDSNYVSSVQYTGGGTRVYQLISGSQGAITNSPLQQNGYSANSGSYGWLLPDLGTILLNPLALKDVAVSGGIGFQYSGSNSATGSIITKPQVSLFTAISGGIALAGTGSEFFINSQENIASNFVFVRPRSSEFNYSENPSFISGSTGEVLYPDFINNPQTYITTVGLYNDSNELLAVAKLSKPLPKNFTKETLLRVKLDF